MYDQIHYKKKKKKEVWNLVLELLIYIVKSLVHAGSIFL